MRMVDDEDADEDEDVLPVDARATRKMVQQAMLEWDPASDSDSDPKQAPPPQ